MNLCKTIFDIEKEKGLGYFCTLEEGHCGSHQAWGGELLIVEWTEPGE